MTMTADPDLRYKNFLDIFGSNGRGSDDRSGPGNAEVADAVFDRNFDRNFDLTFLEMRRS